MPVPSHSGSVDVDAASLSRLAGVRGVLLDSVMAAMTDTVPRVYADGGVDWRTTRDAVDEIFVGALSWVAGDSEPDHDALSMLMEPGRRKGRHRVPRPLLLASISALDRAMQQVLWARTDVGDVPTLRAVIETMRTHGPRMAELLLTGYECGLAEHGHLADLKTAVCRSWLDDRIDLPCRDTLGLPVDGAWLVLVLGQGDAHPSSAVRVLHRALQTGHDVLGTVHDDCLVLVVPHRGGDIVAATDEALRTLGLPLDSGGAPCGVGLAADAGAVAQAWRTAATTRQLALAALDPRPIVTVDDVALERVLHASPHRLAVLRVLDRLGPELRHTIEVLYQLNMDKQAAARALRVHRNTLDYRLRQIDRLAGLHPTSVRGIQLMASALTLRRLAERSVGCPPHEPPVVGQGGRCTA